MPRHLSKAGRARRGETDVPRSKDLARSDWTAFERELARFLFLLFDTRRDVKAVRLG
jgi:hypothetical protein